MKDRHKLFEDIVACTGLASWIAPGAVQRALSSIGVGPGDKVGADHYRRALPQLRARMAMYLRPEELERNIKAIEDLLNEPISSAPGSSAPGSSTPGSSAPGSSAPGSSAPGSSTPGSSAPGSSTPGSSAPGSSAPGSDPGSR